MVADDSVGVAAPVIDLGRLRIQLQRFTEVGNGMVQLAAAGVGQGALKVGGGIGGWSVVGHCT